MPRYGALRALLGDAALQKIRTSKILLVGAGGIGCELLKELVLAGFGEIHVVDLDTVDLSNLNRQFLFERQHVKKSKARVAASVAGKFNPDVHLVPYVSNIITDPEFTFKWFRSFNIVFNALDNAEARRHVNKMCVSTDVPLIDCGTAGFSGQVQVILPRKSECYDCRSHPAPKTFPVCTIRSTPSQPIHCVVWSKSFLFSLLFSPETDQLSENKNEAQEGPEEDKDELQKLNQESNELSDLKKSLREPDFINKLINKVYVVDVERLLLASSLWKSTGAPPPVPLELKPDNLDVLDPTTLDEHSIWTPEQALGVLKFTTRTLISRLDSGETAIEFDKDDESTLDFVVAATVLRSSIFKIPQKSKFEIKQMAGNIIPAVATTNAVVSGLGVLEALKIAGGQRYQTYMRDVNIFRDEKSAFIGDKLQPPDPSCPISNAAHTTIRALPSTKLNELIEEVLRNKLGYDEVSLVAEKLIYDPDFEDQLTKSLQELNLADKTLTIIDENDRRVNLEVYLDCSANSEIGVDSIQIPLKPQIKRSRDEDASEGEGETILPAKKQELETNHQEEVVEINDDGFIVLE